MEGFSKNEFRVINKLKFMSVLKPTKELEVKDYREFCNIFNIKLNKEAGKNGFDEELIARELENIPDQKWLINFIDDSRDGYFRLQLIE